MMNKDVYICELDEATLIKFGVGQLQQKFTPV